MKQTPASSSPSGMDASVQPRLDFIDGLRALAALYVLACHAYYQPAAGYYEPRFMQRLGLTYGNTAVDVFIVVSGFCLMLPVARRDNRMYSVADFFLRRAQRILPAYYACLVLSSLFILLWADQANGTIWFTVLPLNWSAFLQHVFLIHNLPLEGTNRNSINYPLWSIAVEVQIYLLMPVIVLSFRRFGGAVTLGWSVAVGLLLHVITNGKTDTMSTWYIGLFVMGALAARIWVQREGAIPDWWRRVSYGLCLAIAVTILAKGKKFYDSQEPYFGTAVGVAAALLLAVTYSDAHTRRSLLTRALSWKPLVAVGHFSYSLYLIHAPLLHAIDSLIASTVTRNTIARFLLLLAASPLIVGAAYLFYRLFEKPFLPGRTRKERQLERSAQ